MDLTQYNGFRIAEEVQPSEAYEASYTGTSRCKNPDCRSANLVTDWEAGDLVCGECGWVRYSRVEDPGKEWRNVEGDEGRERASGPASRIAQMYEKDAQDVMVQRQSGRDRPAEGSLADRLGKSGGGGGLSGHDKMIEDVFRDVKNLSMKLPGQVPEKTQFDTVQIFKIMWQEHKEKLRRTPELVAACLWTVSFLEHLPFAEADFQRALKGVGVSNPKEGFKKAKQALHRVYTASSKMKELGNAISQRAEGKASQFSKVCVRWTTELVKAAAPGEHYTDQFVFAVATWAAEVGNHIKGAKQEFPDANKMKPEHVYAAAIHVVLHRDGAGEYEEQVTLTKIADKAALQKAGVKEVERFLAKYVARKKGVLAAAARKLRPEQRKLLGVAE